MSQQKKSSLIDIIGMIWLIAFAIFSLTYVATHYDQYFDFFDTSEPEYAETHTGCSYLRLESLPSCFEVYTGYTPKMELDEDSGVATIQLRDKYFVTVQVQKYAEGMWALEFVDDGSSLFDEYGYLAYSCFNREIETEFIMEDGYGIFYTVESCEKFFHQDVPGHDEVTLIITTNYGKNQYYVETSDGETKIAISCNKLGDEYYIMEDGTFLISARVLSQLIYEYELGHLGFDKTTNLGNLID